MPDITDLAHKRGSDGELLPVTKTVEVRGEGDAEVEIYPAGSGQRNEWGRRLQKLDEETEGEELDDETEAELLDEFAAYEPSDFNGAESWSDVRPAITDALANAIFAELFDTEEDDFSEALESAMEDAAGNTEQATKD